MILIQRGGRLGGWRGWDSRQSASRVFALRHFSFFMQPGHFNFPKFTERASCSSQSSPSSSWWQRALFLSIFAAVWQLGKLSKHGEDNEEYNVKDTDNVKDNFKDKDKYNVKDNEKDSSRLEKIKYVVQFFSTVNICVVVVVIFLKKIGQCRTLLLLLVTVIIFIF